LCRKIHGRAEIFYYSDGEETDDEWEEFVKSKENVFGNGEKEIQTRKQVVEGIIASHKEKNAEDHKEPNTTRNICRKRHGNS